MIKDTEIQTRVKKDEHSATVEEECLLKTFDIAFDEIDELLGIVMIHPPKFTANTCTGQCKQSKGQHENLVKSYFQTNRSLEGEYGSCWFMCCRPKSYRPLHVIYRHSNGSFIETTWEKMIATSCECS